MNFFGPYIPCPFDKSHRIIVGRLEKHLFKCRKNFPKDTKVSCPFDARHMLDQEEYEHHISTCPSSGNVKCYQQSLEVEKKVGIPIQATCNVQTNSLCDEDWSGGNVTYNPIAASEGKNVLRTVVGLSKAKKIQFKHYERERIAMLEKKNNNTIDDKSFTQKQPKLEEALRVPKKAAIAMSLDQTSDDKDGEDQVGDLLSKLKKVDLNKDSTLFEKNVSMTNNSCSQESSKENGANNISSENSFSLSSQESISKKKINMTRNDVKSCEKPKETDNKNNSIHQHLNKERNKHRNSRIAANFGDAKKISTGRGFTIAYQKIIKSEMSQAQGENTNLDYYSLYGYEDDKGDNHDSASQSK
ncbi:uncharacterized protein LOC143362848 [Halictus rubicundus]|uniref:uncharacterized protein LOC143362848 n=1 Tax=Halictus rubicundus TaxID=77578 RepID=UPI004035E8CB